MEVRKAKKEDMKKIILILKALLLLAITYIIFVHSHYYLTPNKEMGNLILQISLVFTGFGLLAYSLNINKENGMRNITKTLAIEFRISAIFGIISTIISFMYMEVSNLTGFHPSFLFYFSSITLLLCVMAFLAPILEYDIFSKQ